jgi:hypothetical protein
MKTAIPTVAYVAVLSFAGLLACNEPDATTRSQAITDVDHSGVERQSVGNCWLYSQASWVESMNLAARRASATGAVDELDVSQSYWTYWHWFDQVTDGFFGTEIETGGFQFTGNSIVLERGLMRDADFIPDEATAEASARQASALAQINAELAAGGALSTAEARRDGKLVRQIFDEAWGLSQDMRGQLDRAFGDDGQRTLRLDADLSGTQIISPASVPVRYTELAGSSGQIRDTNLVEAVADWRIARYPFSAADRRAFLQRVQRALHDRQPVVLTWNVDFNALENGDNERRGAFNMQTLAAAGVAGRQGGHMTVLEDYEAETDEFGVLAAATTLNPADPTDAAKLRAALAPSTRIKFLRTKNSWGSLRPDRAFAKDFPGYHDLWLDYLNGPIAWCPDASNPSSGCNDETTPLREVMLPPGY